MKIKNTSGKKGSAKGAETSIHTNSINSANRTNLLTKSPITNPPMPEQAVVPPPHVWNKIEKILNEQERPNAAAKAKLITRNTNLKPRQQNRQPLFTLLGVTVMLCFIIVVL